MLHLHGVGHFHPENEISNSFLEELELDTTNDWIIQRTGIRSRRTVLPLSDIKETRNQDVRATGEVVDYTNADLGRRAAEQAIACAGVDRCDIGLLIAGGSVPETVTPAEGCNIAAALDLDIPSIDLRSACTSFGAAMYLLSRMQEEALPRFVLVVVPETVTRSVDYRDRRSAVIWGDCATAAVVSTREPGRATITCNSLQSSPRGHEKVVVPWAGHFDQDGPAVQAFAVKTTVRVLRAMRDRWFPAVQEGRFYFVGHQANLRMLQTVCRSCEIPEERHLSNVTEFGNTASSGAPSVLSAHWDRFSEGDCVAMVCVGSGLTWTDAMIRFSA
jgi:3-oxoacyl-[acyl-carrier-protein] synthase-3